LVECDAPPAPVCGAPPGISVAVRLQNPTALSEPTALHEPTGELNPTAPGNEREARHARDHDRCAKQDCTTTT
jgi:hypothetical protein